MDYVPESLFISLDLLESFDIICTGRDKRDRTDRRTDRLFPENIILDLTKYQNYYANMICQNIMQIWNSAPSWRDIRFICLSAREIDYFAA